ncbi:MAG: DUF4326 domain-containing protein [Mesorhizobium sp.]|nr:MAG: DUF4326 domain-containing protein [Mesorhizobium sp.]
MPVRIQLSRAKGWRMPENTVSVARPTKWGNPYRVGAIDARTGEIMDADTAVERFLAKVLRQGREAEIRRELRGKNLACWCKPGEPCHADVLLKIANDPSHGATV